MNMTRLLWCWSVLSAVVVWPTSAASEDFSAESIEFFETEVRPLLIARCQKCHGSDQKNKSGLAFISRSAILKGGDNGPAAVAGKPDESLLIEAVSYVSDIKMPPDRRLSTEEVATLRRWVKLGLPWPTGETLRAPSEGGKGLAITEQHRKFWSFQPVQVAPAPAVKDAAWPRHEIDRYILAKLEAAGLTPAAPADPLTLLRRATFDLTGLPPTPQEIDDYLADRSPDRYGRLIERLLASPAYGERWGRLWLDVARYADSRDLRQPPGSKSDLGESFRYRDWVVRAFNRDHPFDRFIIDQIAGDVLAAASPDEVNVEGIVATGFLAIGTWGAGDADLLEMHSDMVDDQINVVCRSFLGLTMACARCHDHKFDPISTADYYALAGIFYSTRIATPQISAPLNRVPLIPPAEVEKINRQSARRAELEKQLKQFIDDQYALLIRQSVPETSRYLLASRECRTDPKAAAQIAADRKLRADALAQWVDYLYAKPTEPQLLPNAMEDLNGHLGVHAWRSKSPLPTLVVNTNDEAVSIPGTLPPKSVAVHPSATAGIAVGWRSPVPATVKVTGRIADAHSACGDGVEWLVQLRQKDRVGVLASGSLANGAAQAIHDSDGTDRLAHVSVDPGDFLVLAVLPKKDQGCDMTLMEWEIVEQGGQGRTWNLARDIVPDLLEMGRGNPHRDSYGNSDVWHFSEIAVNVGALQADQGPGSLLAEWFSLVHNATPNLSRREDLEAVAQKVQAALEAVSQKLTADPSPISDQPSPGERLYRDVASPRGPFRFTIRDDAKMLSPEILAKIKVQRDELEALKKTAATEVPVAIAASEGGVPGTRYAGFNDVRIHLRGSYDRLGELVPRRFPLVLAGENQPPLAQGSGRLELARWIASPSNPLTARVMVNRIWLNHFGNGLVRTPGNFGKVGEAPTHPELLDYLADLFVKSGWSIKAIHRAILMSATYQQSAVASATARATDPENRLFGRRELRRLDAEAIRDSLLAAAGSLDRAIGGPADRDPLSLRRAIYLRTVRSDKSGFRFLFDAADPETVVDRRDTSTVAPQALFLLNHPFTRSLVTRLARRLRNQSPGDDRACVHAAYRLLSGRRPTPHEEEIGLQFVSDARLRYAPAENSDQLAWEDYAQALLCANEMIYVE